MYTARNARGLREMVLCVTCVVIASAGPATAGLIGITSGPSAELYDINEITGVATNARTVGNKVNTIAFSNTGTLYGVSQGFPSDFPPAGGLFTINVTTGAATQVATLDQFIIVEGDIAFDPTSGILYAVDSQGELFTINTNTGAGATIGDVGTNIDLSAMAFDAAGNLFMVDSFGPTLLEVNKSTAAVINSTPMTPINQEIGGLAFRPGDGTLFHAAGTTPELYTLNTGDGNATTIGSIGVSGGIWGLAFVPDPTSIESSTWSHVKGLWR